MRAGLATAAALAAATTTTTVAASTITCSEQIKRKQRDNEVSHPCSQRTKQNKHNRWSVCSNRNIFGSSTFHFSHCDLSFGFKLGEFHMLSIVFADLWTNKTFGEFIEFTEVSAIFNRLGDQILYWSIPFSCFQNENENKAHMSSCHGRKDTIIDICARIDRFVERSIGCLAAVILYLYTEKVMRKNSLRLLNSMIRFQSDFSQSKHSIQC